MKIDAKLVARHELIGLLAEIVDSRNKANIGIRGKIVDETKSTIVIEQQGGTQTKSDSSRKKRLFKGSITLDITINKKTVRIQGEKLLGRPKDRIKNRAKRD